MATFNTTLQLDEPAEHVNARVVAALSRAGVSVNAQPGLIVVTRTYRPGWATTLAIVGALLFLLGLLFLLVKKTDTLTISISSRGEKGCTVMVAGETEPWLIHVVQGALAPTRAGPPRKPRKPLQTQLRSRSPVGTPSSPLATDLTSSREIDPALAPPGQEESDEQVVAQSPGPSAELERLGDLHARGILTDHEFREAKRRVLDS